MSPESYTQTHSYKLYGRCDVSHKSFVHSFSYCLRFSFTVLQFPALGHCVKRTAVPPRLPSCKSCRTSCSARPTLDFPIRNLLGQILVLPSTPGGDFTCNGSLKGCVNKRIWLHKDTVLDCAECTSQCNVKVLHAANSIACCTHVYHLI